MVEHVKCSCGIIVYPYELQWFNYGNNVEQLFAYCPQGCGALFEANLSNITMIPAVEVKEVTPHDKLTDFVKSKYSERFEAKKQELRDRLGL